MARVQIRLPNAFIDSLDAASRGRAAHASKPHQCNRTRHQAALAFNRTTTQRFGHNGREGELER